MAHKNQTDFVARIAARFPAHFTHTTVFEVGSLNINGSIRSMFTEPRTYIGVDLGPGRDVDIVCRAHEYPPPQVATPNGVCAQNQFDITISCEALEHDSQWPRTFARMWELCRPGGLVVFTCATTGRAEHGTARALTSDSPFTPEYYRNLTQSDFEALFNIPEMFDTFEWATNTETNDLYFWGQKRQYTLPTQNPERSEPSRPQGSTV